MSRVEALVVSLNEEHLLRRSLPTLAFCDEKTLIDLGSTDGSRRVAEEHGFRVLPAENQGFVEAIHAEYLRKNGAEWILFLDPDEELSGELLSCLSGIHQRLSQDPSVGGYSADWRFFFRGRPLENGPWSGNKKVFLVRKKAFRFLAVSHQGKELRDGYHVPVIDEQGGAFIRHNWASSWSDLIAKHTRYLSATKQGRGRVEQGKPLLRAIRTFWRQFYKAFVVTKSHRDGLDGVLLGIFWVTYQSFSAFLAAKAGAVAATPGLRK